jgi:hypothetical protein
MSQHAARWRLTLGAGPITPAILATGCAGAGGDGGTDAAGNPVGFVSSQGLFVAKLCAAATLVSRPVLIAGFAAQDKLVRGLSLGAVK